MGQDCRSLKHVKKTCIWPRGQLRKSRFFSGYDKNKIKVTESSEARKRLMNLYYFKKKTKKQKTKQNHLLEALKNTEAQNLLCITFMYDYESV